MWSVFLRVEMKSLIWLHEAKWTKKGYQWNVNVYWICLNEKGLQVRAVMEWIVSTRNSCRNPNPMWLYLEMRHLIKVKRGHRGETLIQLDWCSYKKRKRHHKYTHKEKATICKPKGILTRNQPFWVLDLRFPASRTARNKLLLFTPHSLWHFVMEP